MVNYRLATAAEKKEVEELRKLAESKGKTLCGIKDMMHLMGKEKFMDAIYNKTISPVADIACRAYYFWPLD